MLLTEIPLRVDCSEMFKTNITLHVTLKHKVNLGLGLSTRY